MSRTATVLLFMLGSGQIATAQTTYHVDDDAPPDRSGRLKAGGTIHNLTQDTFHAAIQEAIDAAVDGDEIAVGPGTYVERLDMLGKAITLRSTHGPDVTIIDGDAAGTVITCDSGETPDTLIDGFTITNGSAELGGGLHLSYSSPTITNNRITGSSARQGGGLYLVNSHPTITNNTIANNDVTGGGQASGGGGLYLAYSFAAIMNNRITGNSANGPGGGLRLNRSSPTIANNTVMGNSATSGGGGLYLAESSPTIANNTITGNGAHSYGGGLTLSSSSFATIVNNTITGNSAGGGGGGLSLNRSYPTIANTIVAFNSSGIRLHVGAPTLRFNCVYGNRAYDYDGLADPTGTDGNISEKPRLADWQYGNVHIQPDSPCVDAGRNADAWGDFDIDGEPRKSEAGGTVDIGADETNGDVWPEGPYAIVRVSPEGTDTNDGSSWRLAKRTVQAGIDAAAAFGGEVWVRAGRYEEHITLHAHAYGGFAGTETTRGPRDWAANVTTLDGGQQGSVVTARTGYRVSTIDGFTITNGSAEFGGGLYLFGSAPTIANNMITGNSADDTGGGVYLHSSAPTIANNTITGNSAHTGGGLSLFFSSPTLTGNTITGNSAGIRGGGLYVTGSPSSLTIANTIVAFNSSGIRLGGDAPTPTLRHNCVFGNGEYDYIGMDDPAGTDGNISVDPRLADPRYGNVHIQPDSPCVDAGSHADAWGDSDMDGDPRILPVGGIVDIGADESDGTAWPSGPYAIVRVSPEGDDVNDGSSWTVTKRTVQAGIDAASALGGEVWVGAGTYEERITLPPHAHTYGGFVGVETEREQRDWAAHVTVLDGQQQGSVVIARGGYRNSAIDGFTITGGTGSYRGGGLLLSYCSPTIANNTITGNTTDSRGGGLSLGYSSATIANNTIAGNSAAYDGGGLHVEFSSPTITNNTIMGNSAGMFGRGGGLYVSHSSPTIVNNTITGNDTGYRGGGMFLDGASPTMTNNAITGNSADDTGGGLYLSSSSPTLANSTITGNSANWSGGGLALFNSSPTIANTIVAFNSSGVYRTGGTATLRYNCVYSNTEYDYDGLADPTGTDGNLSVAPLFARDPDSGPDGQWGTGDDDYGDLHLSLDSPVIDAGDNAEVPADVDDLDGDGDTTEPMPFDLDGFARFVDDPQTSDTGSGSPPMVDMGAYERRPGDCLHDGVTNHDGDVDFVDYVGLVGCLAGPATDAPAGCECLDLDGSAHVDLADVAFFQLSFTGE